MNDHTTVTFVEKLLEDKITSEITNLPTVKKNHLNASNVKEVFVNHEHAMSINKIASYEVLPVHQ